MPPGSEAVAQRVAEIGAAFGFSGVELHVSPTLGTVCLPVSTEPPVLVLGAALVAEANAELRDFLVIRAFKILQGHVAAFSRTAPIDLWPLAAAFLGAFAPKWQPQGVDPAKLKDYKARIEKVVASVRGGDDLGVLALDVVGSLGNRASTLQTAANAWGARAALLALGDPTVALDAIAWASGQAHGAPPAGVERMRWIGRNAEARDIVVFSVSDAYVEARSKA
jgi:hypothetical protein